MSLPTADTASAHLLRPCLFGPVSHWALRAAGCAVLPSGLFDKRRKEMHRYTIADVNGPLTLTVPVEKPHGVPRATWSQVALSAHNGWWRTHLTALESAYGRTPFFEFYIDRFLPFFSEEALTHFRSVEEYRLAADRLIGSLLLIDGTREGPADLPRLTQASVAQTPQVVPYWQPRASKLSFLADLSVLDLLFCLGPEAAIYIRNLCSPCE